MRKVEIIHVNQDLKIDPKVHCIILMNFKTRNSKGYSQLQNEKAIFAFLI